MSPQPQAKSAASRTIGSMKAVPVKPASGKAVSVKPISVKASACPNRRIVMNALPSDSPRLVATRDLFDRAHDAMDGGCRLIPAAVVVGEKRRGGVVKPTVRLSATPRKYAECYINGRGVSVDSQFDWLYEAQQRLDGVPGIGDQSTVAEHVHVAMSKMRPETGRDFVRPKTRG